MEDLIIFRPGAEVTVMGGITGIVRSVMIDGEDGMLVQYKVSWLSGSDLRETWVDAFMVSLVERPVVRLGFK